MNNGAFVYKRNLFSEAEIAEIAALAKDHEKIKRGVHTSGKYIDLKWFQVDLSPNLIFCRKILDALNVVQPVMIGFYYLDPGAKLHPHRDLTGASLNNRIRFHIPIITSKDVKFFVSSEEIKMKPGDLWLLDTSYLHAVENMGTQSRIHIIIECDINDEIRKNIPNGFNANLHNLFYSVILILSFLKAIFFNSIKDPKYFFDQMGMVYKFLKWRFFKSHHKK